MKIEEILDVIKTLAQSQGLYGRILETITYLQEHEQEAWNDVKEKLEAENFKDSLEVVMYFES